LQQSLPLRRRPAGHDDVQPRLAREPLDKSSPEKTVSADDEYAVRVHDGV
jgi:hypothetical protein